MKIVALNQDLVPAVMELMKLGEPYIRVRTQSDYWLYAHLFASTCPVAMTDNGEIIGSLIAFRSQDHPEDVYIQDLVTHPGHRRQGVAKALLDHLSARAARWGCARLSLTSEPDNEIAHATWTSLGFRNIPGDRTENEIHVISGFKGPGKDRAVYERPVQ